MNKKIASDKEFHLSGGFSLINDMEKFKLGTKKKTIFHMQYPQPPIWRTNIIILGFMCALRFYAKNNDFFGDNANDLYKGVVIVAKARIVF